MILRKLLGIRKPNLFRFCIVALFIFMNSAEFSYSSIAHSQIAESASLPTISQTSLSDSQTNVSDPQGSYSNQVSLGLTAIVHPVLNRFVQNPPYSKVNPNCGPVSNPFGGATTDSYCKLDSTTSEIRLWDRVDLPATACVTAPCAQAVVDSSVDLQDEFHILRNGWYRVSFYFVLSGKVTGSATAGLEGAVLLQGTTELTANLTASNGSSVWDSGPITVDEHNAECSAMFTGGIDVCSTGFQDYLNIQHSLTSPWL